MGDILDIDHGWNSIKQNFRRMDRSYSKIGVQEGTLHKDKDKPGHLSELVVIAAVHEFGAPKRNIPERSVFRSTFDENLNELHRFTDKLRPLYMKNPRLALKVLGAWMENKIKDKILTLRTPPNAPSTIARKKSSNPLIDTAQYRQSITAVEVMAT